MCNIKQNAARALNKAVVPKKESGVHTEEAQRYLNEGRR